MTQQSREPVFNAPAVAIALIGVFAAIHFGRQLLEPRLDDWVVTTFAFIPARFSEAGSHWPAPSWAGPVSLVSHALLHGDLLHLAINSAWLLAVGTPVARRMTAGRFVLFAGLCAIAGALLFMAFNFGLDRPMVGASGAVSGLMAAVFRLMFAATTPFERFRLRHHPAHARRLSLAETFTNRNAVLAIAIWVGVNILFGYGFDGLGTPGGVPGSSAGGIAWEAHLGGFFAGLLVFGSLDQGREMPPPESWDEDDAYDDRA